MPLIVTPVTKTAIAALSKRAHQSPYTQPHLKRLFYQPLPERSLTVPHGYRMVFTVGQFRPGWLARHLSVSAADRPPLAQDLRLLMQLFDFQNEAEHCLAWTGGPLGPHSVNVLEPCDGKDWAPLSRSA